MLTYQTRCTFNEQLEKIFQEYANLLSTVERKLYVETAKGNTAASCKNDFLKKYGITARQFNACRVSLEGKIAAYRASQNLSLANRKRQIQLLDKQIENLRKKPSKSFILHQKKRRRSVLFFRFLALEEDIRKKRTRLCFGGKKLFKAQFNLQKNGFSSHLEWQSKWKEERNNEFFLLGSKDETSGNQTCTAKIKPDGTLSLRLRLPKALEEKHGKYVEVENIYFSYGQEAVLASLNDPEGQALSYRFKKDRKGWRVFVSTALKKEEIVSLENNGTIGIDVNADHIAFVETDRFGNPIYKKNFPLISYGKNKNQLKAALGEISKEIVELAKKAKKPLVIEDLDFQRKKLSLAEEASSKFARMLSSFAYSLFFSFLKSRSYKQGVTVHSINPAFTSTIGRVNYAHRYGLSIHLAAALCIARRHQKFSETPCTTIGIIPDGKGCHVTFVLPERNRTKHVWHFWGQVNRKIKTVLAARFRAILSYRSLSPSNSTLEIGNSRLLLVESQYVNR